MPSPKPSSDIRKISKRIEHQRKQVAPEKEGNVPSNNIKLDFILIDYNHLLSFLLLVSYLYKDSASYIVS